MPYQVPDPAQAAKRALDFTGIPDLAQGANALARGEWLPGLGQAASGAAGLLPLGKLAGAAKLGAELMPLGGLIKAWHGTPHLFEPVPARAVEESGITAYHATPAGFNGDFESGTHFGTIDAAHERLQEILRTPNVSRYPYHPREGEEAPAVYRVKLKPKKILDTPDLGDFSDSDIASHLYEKNLITGNEFGQIQNGEIGATDVLRQKGYDALRYTNTYESPGSVSHMVLDPSIISPTHRLEPPNPFGEFRDAAIGTGEGAQAYGHGHYVAGNPAVAEEYQRSLSGQRAVPADESGTPLSGVDIARKFYEPGAIVPSYGGQFDRVIKFNESNDSGRWSVNVEAVKPKADSPRLALEEMLKDPGLWEPQRFGGPRNHSTFPKEKAIEDIGKVRGWPMTKPGSLLEVHILPDEHELLDWDKPLAEQPPGVKKVIDQIHAGNEDLRIMHSGPDITGANFYRNLANQMWDKTREGIGGGSVAASKALHEAGIPGIKYLDRGSRDAGEGTSNYVIFDPKNLRIVGRNGQRLEPVEEDPFK